VSLLQMLRANALSAHPLRADCFHHDCQRHQRRHTLALCLAGKLIFGLIDQQIENKAQRENIASLKLSKQDGDTHSILQQQFIQIRAEDVTNYFIFVMIVFFAYHCLNFIYSFGN
jgi:hypothetical protein